MTMTKPTTLADLEAASHELHRDIVGLARALPTYGLQAQAAARKAINKLTAKKAEIDNDIYCIKHQ
jgi:hypothetical protein